MRQRTRDGRDSGSSRRRRHPRSIGCVIPWHEAQANDISTRRLRGADNVFGLGSRDFPDTRKERSLIGVRNHGVVKEHAVSVIAGVFLQRQCDEIFELVLGKCVLIEEESVVGSQFDLGPSLHGLLE